MVCRALCDGAASRRDPGQKARDCAASYHYAGLNHNLHYGTHPITKKRKLIYGAGTMIRDPRNRQISTHALIRADAGLRPESCSAADVPLQLAHLGRVARASVSPARRSPTRVVVLGRARKQVAELTARTPVR